MMEIMIAVAWADIILCTIGRHIGAFIIAIVAGLLVMVCINKRRKRRSGGR